MSPAYGFDVCHVGVVGLDELQEGGYARARLGQLLSLSAVKFTGVHNPMASIILKESTRPCSAQMIATFTPFQTVFTEATMLSKGT